MFFKSTINKKHGKKRVQRIINKAMCLITALKESTMSETRRLHVNETNGIFKSFANNQQQQQLKRGI